MYEANRLVKILDEEAILRHCQRLLERLKDEIRSRSREPTELLGTLQDLRVEDAWGAAEVVVSSCPSTSPPAWGLEWFPGGSYSRHDGTITVEAQGCYSVDAWLEPTAEPGQLDSLIDVYAHELTHRHDPGVWRSRSVDRAALAAHAIKQATTAEEAKAALAEYINSTVEVKAWARNVYTQTEQHVAFLERQLEKWRGSKHEAKLRDAYRSFAEGRGAQGALEQYAKRTEAFRSAQRMGMTEANQRRVLRDVYVEARQGLLQRIADLLA